MSRREIVIASPPVPEAQLIAIQQMFDRLGFRPMAWDAWPDFWTGGDSFDPPQISCTRGDDRSAPVALEASRPSFLACVLPPRRAAVDIAMSAYRQHHHRDPSTYLVTDVVDECLARINELYVAASNSRARIRAAVFRTGDMAAIIRQIHTKHITLEKDNNR